MNFRKLFGLLAFMVVFLFVLTKGLQYESYFFYQHNKTMNPWPYAIFMSLLPVAAGLVLALPAFVIEFRQTGRWKIDWAKLIGICIPTLYFSVIPLVMFTPLIKYFPFYHASLGKDIFTICGIIFGYSLLGSFRREEIDSKWAS